MSIRNKLRKHPTLTDAQIEGEENAATSTIQPQPENSDYINDSTGNVPNPPENPNVPNKGEDDNPFEDSGDELTAVSLGAETLSTDPEKLPIIANHNSTRAFAAISAKADWLGRIGDEKGAATRISIRDNLLKFGISQAGETNRVTQLFEMLKAAYSFEQQKELSTGERVMGKK